MNTRKIASVLSLAVLASLGASKGALATETWKGQGELFARDGSSEGAYALVITSAETAPGLRHDQIQVTLPDGRVLSFAQDVRKSGNGFSIVSDQGNGGGLCFGEGLCEGYLDQGGGKAIAMTIVQDGEGKRRMLRTELENGRAVRFFRESITRE